MSEERAKMKSVSVTNVFKSNLAGVVKLIWPKRQSLAVLTLSCAHNPHVDVRCGSEQGKSQLGHKVAVLGQSGRGSLVEMKNRLIVFIVIVIIHNSFLPRGGSRCFQVLGSVCLHWVWEMLGRTNLLIGRWNSYLEIHGRFWLSLLGNSSSLFILTHRRKLLLLFLLHRLWTDVNRGLKPFGQYFSLPINESLLVSLVLHRRLLLIFSTFRKLFLTMLIRNYSELWEEYGYW